VGPSDIFSLNNNQNIMIQPKVSSMDRLFGFPPSHNLFFLDAEPFV
jgi:hypothetical protein